jgi:hypothetical protein
MADEQGLKSFFQTVPGILTAIATLLVAVSGLVAALNQIGFFNTAPHPLPNPDASAISLQTPAAEGSATTNSDTDTQALLDDLRGCWHTGNTLEIVESRVATGTFTCRAALSLARWISVSRIVTMARFTSNHLLMVM